MKIGLFTDSHFSSATVTCGNRYNSRSLKKIEDALKIFSEQKCDLVISLGDLIDKENNREKEIQNLKKVSRVFSGYDLDIRVIMGNHDAFTFSENEFYSILGLQHKPQNIYSDTVNLIFIDACWFKNGVHYNPGDSDWTDTFYPGTQELETILSGIKGDSYIFMHQNIDPGIRIDHRLSNDAEIREILENSHKVKTVFQGHYHPGFVSELNGINYITYPAMCENDNAVFIVDL